MSKSLVDQLPSTVRKWLERQLREKNFTGYRELTEDLNERLAKEGLELKISKSGLHRWGKQIDERIDAIRKTTEAAIQIRDLVGDDEGALTDSLTRLVQERLFDVVVQMEVDPSKADIYKLGKVIAELGRASVAQKKWAAEYRERIDKKLEALEAADEFDAPTLARVRDEIYGVAP